MSSREESPPPEKSAYELQRDRNVAEVQKAIAPALAVRKQLDEEQAKEKSGRVIPNSGKKGDLPPRRSERRRGLRGREGTKSRRRHRSGGRGLGSREMSSTLYSSSEATKSDDEAIATGMMHLAIACTHVERQSGKEAKAAAEQSAFDSSEEEFELEDEQPLVDRRTKRKKHTIPQASPTKLALPPPPAVDPNLYSQPNWSWIPGHYIPSQAPPPALPSAWPNQSSGLVGQDSEEHFSRRKRKMDYDLSRRQRATAGVKPNRVFVLEGVEVDATCEGKNAWDEALWDLVPKCLDMSIVDWSQHESHTVKKLRAALDTEFEYLGHPLSMVGFRLSMQKYMKAERSRLKTRYLRGQDSPPLHIDKTEWDRLKLYWNTDAQKMKAQKMAVARSSVKNLTQVGRKGRSGKEALRRVGSESGPRFTNEGQDTLPNEMHEAPSNVSLNFEFFCSGFCCQCWPMRGYPNSGSMVGPEEAARPCAGP